MSDMLIAKGLSKFYRNGPKMVRAVDSVDLVLRKNRSYSIVGQSGAGKSTLLHLLGGLDIPTSGHVLFDGIDMFKLRDSERSRLRNKRIGFVFQFYHLLPEFTALENVMMPALIGGRAARAIADRACGILKLVGLTSRLNHRPSELSGGESQRVAIARALMNEPDVLLCDEPTGNLDSKTSDSIMELFFDIKSKKNMMLVFVTHDEKIAARMDEAVRIKDGRLEG